MREAFATPDVESGELPQLPIQVPPGASPKKIQTERIASRDTSRGRKFAGPRGASP